MSIQFYAIIKTKAKKPRLLMERAQNFNEAVSKFEQNLAHKDKMSEIITITTDINIVPFSSKEKKAKIRKDIDSFQKLGEAILSISNVGFLYDTFKPSKRLANEHSNRQLAALSLYQEKTQVATYTYTFKLLYDKKYEVELRWLDKKICTFITTRVFITPKFYTFLEDHIKESAPRNTKQAEQFGGKGVKQSASKYLFHEVKIKQI